MSQTLKASTRFPTFRSQCQFRCFCDQTIVVTVNHKEAVITVEPACVVSGTIAIIIESCLRLFAFDQFDTITVEVQRNRREHTIFSIRERQDSVSS